MSKNSAVCFIMPPYLMQKLLESKNREDRQVALDNLMITAGLRGERAVRATFAGATLDTGNGRRTIADCQTGRNLAFAEVVRTEDGPAASDASANRAFEGFGATRDFFKQVFDRDSIDGNGMRLDGYIHYGINYNNAFWDGAEMVFGDGDGVRFTDFTMSLDVIAHELGHGVTESAAGLKYHNQSGALNESMSDVFGSLVKQWTLSQSASQADWLIGKEIFSPGASGDSLRSMKAPGTAYDHPVFGKDPQPDHMSKFVIKPDTYEGDWGAVHYNSGIPNKAFFLVATSLGGNAWEAPGHIWYESLKASNQDTEFREFADTTYQKAGQLYGSSEQAAVLSAWHEVGIHISGVPAAARARAGVPGRNGDGLAAVTKLVEGLSVQLKTLAKDLSDLKSRP